MQASNALCVANYSGSGGYNPTMNTAVANAVAIANVVFVTSAGNNDADACNYSPQSADAAITVGGTTSSDGVSSSISSVPSGQMHI